MPNYVYKTRETRNCACAWPGIMVMQALSDDALTACPACGEPVYRAIQRPRFQFRHGMKGDMRDYREDLARFPGDPECYTDGPRSVRKLWDRRQRQGWRKGCGLDELYDSNRGCSTRDVPGEDTLFDEAYREARATGFSLDDPDVQGLLDDSEAA